MAEEKEDYLSLAVLVNKRSVLDVFFISDSRKYWKFLRKIIMIWNWQ